MTITYKKSVVMVPRIVKLQDRQKERAWGQTTIKISDTKIEMTPNRENPDNDLVEIFSKSAHSQEFGRPQNFRGSEIKESPECKRREIGWFR